MKAPLQVKNILFNGNNLGLDFINTIHNRYAEEPIDYLVNRTTWIIWLQKKGLVDNGSAMDSPLFDLQKIKQLRALLYSIFYGIINRRKPLKKDIAEFNRQVLKLRKATTFSIENGMPTEKIDIDHKNLNSYLLPIIAQAHQLLLNNDIGKVKECGNCGWLFLDTSKSNKRKWCTMKTCGNEVKARRHYQRIKNKKNSKPKTP